MSIKRESTQSIPSVMAKLMGLDEIPTQLSVPKKPKVLSENYLLRVSSIGVREKCSAQQSFKLSMEDQDEYKNVLQVLETLRRKKLRHKPVANEEVHLGSSDVKRRFVMQKVREGKHVSGDGKRQISQDSHDDYALEYLQKPDIWCTKKHNEPNDAHSNLQLGHVAVLNLPLGSDSRDIRKCVKFRRNSELVYLNAPKKVRNSLGVYSSRGLRIDDLSEFWRSIPTSRIVVTKPNQEKADIAAGSQSDSVSHSGYGKKNEILIPPNKNLYVERKERKSMSNGLGPVRPRFRFLKERTKIVGQGISSMPIVEPRSELTDGDHFAKESELTMPYSPSLSDRKWQINSSGGSYMTKEAKKQISEKWKTTKRFQQVELPGRSKTLDEMLAIPNKPEKCRRSNQGVPDIGNISCGSPLRMSSWDIRKHEFVRDLPRSRSLLPYFDAVGSPNSKTRQESLENGGYMRNLYSNNMMQNESREQESNQKDGLKCRTDSAYKKSQASVCMVPENNLSVRDYVGHDEQENKLKKGSTDKISAGSQSSEQNNQTLHDMWIKQKGHKNEVREDVPTEINSIVPNSTKSSFSIGVEVDTKTKALKKSPSNYEKHELESSSCILLEKEEDSSHIQDASCIQEMSNGTFEEESVSPSCSCTDLESLISCEEAYQPSPNSVLERVCKKENSSDCFESVNASLHGLYMQLELLKAETSEAYSEGSRMVVSSDDDSWEGSINDFEENEGLMSPFRVEESRNFSYLVDVLTETGFQNRNLGAGLGTLYSQEFPISYSLFETLEKKYGEQLSWKRTERRLLFDRINSCLAEMLQPFMGALTWTKPVARRFVFGQGGEKIEEELWMLLVSQEKEVSKESEKILGKDYGWMELGDEIQHICREIENSLIDELVADVSMQSFC